MRVPNPGLEQAEPELRLEPNDRRISEAGWTRRDVGNIVRALGDGLYVGEHFDGEKRMDIILRAKSGSARSSWRPHPAGDALVATRFQLGELVDVQRTVGPSQLVRIDGRRTVTLDIARRKTCPWSGS